MVRRDLRVYVCMCIPVRFVVGIDSSKALAPSDGFGGKASDWANGQRHRRQSSGRSPCLEQRKKSTLLTTQHN